VCFLLQFFGDDDMNLRGWFATTGRTGEGHDLPESLSWECVSDPSGAFLGRVFRRIDLDTSAQMKTWPASIEFRCQRTGERLRYSLGRLENIAETVISWLLYLDGHRVIYRSSRQSVPDAVLKRYHVEPGSERLEWRTA
jgi:hypothetical protein